MTGKLVASLACRAASSRLYAKPLQMLDVERGVTVLDHMIALLATEPAFAEIVLAVSEGLENEPFHQIAQRHGLRSIRGDQKDVLGRHLQTAEISGATDIFIVTTESPFTYFEAIDEAWRLHRENRTNVTATEGLPIGSAFGIYSVETLRRSHELGDSRHRSEFISLYVREHPEEFRIQVLEAPPDVRRLDIRLTIDYPEDLVLCRRVYEHFRGLGPRIPVARIVSFLDGHPELTDLVKPYVEAERLYKQVEAELNGAPRPQGIRENDGSAGAGELTMAGKGYIKPSIGSERELKARARLMELFKNSPIPDDEILVNLGLYTRAIILAKILYLNELYQRILDIPGIIVEFGVWWGANLALFEAFRSVYEPYNWTRRVVGFDTFEGYQEISAKDGDSPYVAAGGFGVTEGYEAYLSQVLEAQEQDNVNAQVTKYELVKGNVMDTIDRYLADRPETVIALAYFDLALYEPTKKCLEAIRPHLVRGSVLAMDELNSQDFPGETIAFKEVVGLDRYRIHRSRFLPDRSYVVVE